jgi:methionyl-tRNA formyltransferase
MPPNKLRIAIITSDQNGTAAHHLPYLYKNQDVDICAVIYCTNTGVKTNYKKKLKKIFTIGLLGALNGIRMRKWFTSDVDQLLKTDSVVNFCSQHLIPYFETPKLNSKTTLNQLIECQPDVGISLGNSYISEKIFNAPKEGMINIHHEILPEYQNAQSIIWQIYNSSTFSGYTIHKIEKSIDTGSILFQEKVPIQFRESLRKTINLTAIELLKQSSLGINHVLSNWSTIYDNATPQFKGRVYTTPSFFQFIRIYINYRRFKNMK